MASAAGATTVAARSQTGVSAVDMAPVTSRAAPRAGRLTAPDASPAGGLAGPSGLGLTGSFPSDNLPATGEHAAGRFGHLRR